MSKTDAALFEHFTLLNKHSYETTSRQLLTRMPEPVQNMRNAVSKMQRTDCSVNKSGRKAGVYKKRQVLDRERWYLALDRMQLSLQKMIKATGIREPNLSSRHRYG